MKEQLYAINLEDYSSVRHAPAVRTYIGTKQDMLVFADRLEQIKQAAEYYAGTINAIRLYDEHPDGVHAQCNKNYPIFTSAEEVARKEFFVDDYEWTYKTVNGACFVVQAEQVWVSQMIVKMEGALVRCSKAVFEDLAAGYSGIGWIRLNGHSTGFPGMVHWERNKGSEDGTQHMSLYIVQKSYSIDELQIAIDDMRGPLTYDMTDVTRDILGTG